jgi:hypothetical protein
METIQEKAKGEMAHMVARGVPRDAAWEIVIEKLRIPSEDDYPDPNTYPFFSSSDNSRRPPAFFRHGYSVGTKSSHFENSR